MILEEAGYSQCDHDAMVGRVRERKNQTFSDAVERLADGYVGLYDLNGDWEINAGMCEDFASDVVGIFPEAKAIWDDELPGGPCNGGHCVVCYRGEYYDAECPEGVENWNELPIYRRHK